MSENEIRSASDANNTGANPAGSTGQGVTNPPAQGANPPGNDVTNPSNKPADNDSLDFDNLLKVPETKEERDGKSRREWMKEHGGQPTPPKSKQPAEMTDEEKAEEAMFDKFAKRFEDRFSAIDRLEQRSKGDDRRFMEDTFKSTLEDKGISVRDFNEKHKADFEKERNKFLERGLTPEDAVLTALDIVTARYEAGKQLKESEDRASGRQRARLSPQSTFSPGQTTYTQQQLAEAPQSEYNRIMDGVERGEFKIID